MGPGEGHCQLAPGCRECVSLGALPTVLLGLTLWWSHSFTPLCGVPPHPDSAPPGGREVQGNHPPPDPQQNPFTPGARSAFPGTLHVTWNFSN